MAQVLDGSDIRWTSDVSGNRAGWRMCSSTLFTAPSPPPPQPPWPPSAPPVLFGIDGPCELTGGRDCVRSPAYPTPYPKTESCTISPLWSPLDSLVVSAMSFSTVGARDTLSVEGVAYSGDAGPANVVLSGPFSWAPTPRCVSGSGLGTFRNPTASECPSSSSDRYSGLAYCNSVGVGGLCKLLAGSTCGAGELAELGGSYSCCADSIYDGKADCSGSNVILKRISADSPAPSG